MFLRDLVFLKWYLLHARLNSHNEAWSCRKRKRKRLRASKKAVLTESKDERCQKILYAKNLEFSCVRKETVDIDILITSRDGDRKIMQSIRITNGTPSENKEVEPVEQVQMNSCSDVFITCMLRIVHHPVKFCSNKPFKTEDITRQRLLTIHEYRNNVQT